MGLISGLLNIYILVIIIDSILSYLPKYSNTNWALTIKSLANFTLNPIRKILPSDWPYDFSPIVAIILIKIIQALW